MITAKEAKNITQSYSRKKLKRIVDEEIRNAAKEGQNFICLEVPGYCKEEGISVLDELRIAGFYVKSYHTYFTSEGLPLIDSIEIRW